MLTLNRKRFELLEGDVTYQSFEELSLNKIGDIQREHLEQVGIEEYKQQLEQ